MSDGTDQEKTIPGIHVEHASLSQEEKDRPDLDKAQLHQVIGDEHASTLRDSWRTHKKAMFWSMGVSLVRPRPASSNTKPSCSGILPPCHTLTVRQIIVMESYNTMLISTFFAYPTFQRSFGEQLPNGNYSIPAKWMTALGTWYSALT